MLISLLACQTAGPDVDEPDQPSEAVPVAVNPPALPVAAVLSPSNGPCPDGMTYVPAGTYTTGMTGAFPYGVVDTTKMDVVEAPEEDCPAAIAGTPDAVACWVQTDLHDPVVRPHEVRVDGYCMERRPFPGAGPYPADGMTTYDAQKLEELLATGAFGPRRLCTYTEYELAVAGPTTNQRFVYGDTPDDALCPGDEEAGIAGLESCRNAESGLYDYGAVISQWVRLDDELVRWACGDRSAEIAEQGVDPCRASGGARLDERHADGTFKVNYLVAGGTRRVQTRQAPYTPHTYHDHGQVTGSDGCDAWGWDDGPAICADPDARWGAEEGRAWAAAWSELVASCLGERMTTCMNAGFQHATGDPVDICPGDGELGSGQGR